MKTTQQPEEKGHKRELEGVVVRKSGSKTVAVEVVRVIAHALYGKRMKRTKRYLAHDTTDSLVVGDKVVIQESRPLSALKRWIVLPKKEKAL